MIVKIAGYFMSVVAASMLVAIAMQMISNERIRKIVALAGGAVVLICVLTPLLHLDLDSISFDFSNLLERQSEELEQMKTDSEQEICRIIIETTEAYILDKADKVGAVVSVQVTAEEAEGGYFYPDMVSLTGVVTSAQKRELSVYLRDVLGIDESRQIWRTV